MKNPNVLESLIVGVVFIAVFGMKFAADNPTPTATIAAQSTGVQLQAGPLNLVVQVGEGND